MPLATTRRSGLVDQVISQMRDAIAAGEWRVGGRIPTEPELVAMLGVGRNTVREAVSALSHAGLLDVRQGDGTFVRATSEISGALQRMCGTQLREALQVRRTLEVEGARLAALSRTEAELTELTELLTNCEAARDAQDWPVAVDFDAQFHTAVVRCSHNALLAELHKGLTEVVRASVATFMDTPPARRIQHRGLLTAIAEGDPERAAEEAGGFFDELLADLNASP